MPRSETNVAQQLMDACDRGLPPEEVVRLMQSVRQSDPESSEMIDRLMLERHNRLRKGLEQASETQAKLKALHEKLTEAPWFPAVFIDAVDTPQGQKAIVMQGSSCRLVGAADGVDLQELQRGDEVYLGNQQNVIMARSSLGLRPCGETATFDAYAPDGRLVLKSRDDIIVVDAAKALSDLTLNPGDLLRWDRQYMMAFERLPRTEGRRFMLDDVPVTDACQVGGQDGNLRTLLSALTTILVAPDKAELYGLGGRQSIVLVGPPGCGKTLMSRVGASEISRISGKKCRFGVVKPAEWENAYVGATQANIRNCFKALGEAADRDSYAVLFMDEIESVGRIRGGMASHHSDKFLAALLAELDGFTSRSGVAVIAATNRKDLVDPALLERLSDVEIYVDRPTMQGARAIFDIHLPDTVPYSPNGDAAEATRAEIADTAVSMFYSPRSDSEICEIRFRDGSTRRVSARELTSGRVFEQVCRAARRSAFLRDVEGGEPGVQVRDIQEATQQAIGRMRTMLSVHNARAYLSGLPDDLDVVAVEPVVPKVERPHQYTNVN